MRLLIMGAPGAGKGTQATALAEAANVPAISTGDIFRTNIRAGTPLGVRVRQLIEAGEFVPDELTEQVVADRLTEPDAADGFLLDGFPRTLAQARWLDAHLGAQGVGLDAAVSLVVAPDALLARLLRRAEIEGRADDNEQTIRRRMEVYAGQTAPLLSHYESQQLLVEVDGDGDVETVRERMLAALDAHVRHAEAQRERWSRPPR